MTPPTPARELKNNAIAAALAAGINDDLGTLTGHPPRRLADFVAENANAWK